MAEKQYLIDAWELGESWRLFRIIAEFVEGIEELHKIYPAVSIFGSARVTPDDPIYKKAELIGRKCAEAGYAVITGGGGGVMVHIGDRRHAAAQRVQRPGHAPPVDHLRVEQRLPAKQGGVEESFEVDLLH